MRLAHLSDLHLLSLDGARALQFANKRWIGAINLLSNRARHYHTEAFEHMVEDLNAQQLDHIVCTGDITNLAFASEFAFARSRFDRLRLGPAHVTVLPGNHDTYVPEGIGYYETQFAPYMESDPVFREAAWPVVRVRGELALIGLSTSLPTPWFTAWGKVGQAQLARLAELLRHPALADKTRVVALHHPPVGPRAESWVRGLRDHVALAKVIDDGGATLVLHGHEHRHMTEWMGVRQTPVWGVPSATYHAHRPERTARYRIIDLEGGRVVASHMRVWHPARKSFAHDDQTPAPASIAP